MNTNGHKDLLRSILFLTVERWKSLEILQATILSFPLGIAICF